MNFRNRSGLTLIEVVLAVAILSVGFTMLLTAAGRCLAVMKAAHTYQKAQWVLGLGQAEHPILDVEKIEDLEVDAEEYEGGFIFSRTVGEDEDEDGLYVLRTRVTWRAREQDYIEEVVRYVRFDDEEE